MFEAFKKSLISQLNVLGMAAIFYMIAHPEAPAQMVAMFPEALQPLMQLFIPVLWGIGVQAAIIMRDNQKAKEMVK